VQPVKPTGTIENDLEPAVTSQRPGLQYLAQRFSTCQRKHVTVNPIIIAELMKESGQSWVANKGQNLRIRRWRPGRLGRQRQVAADHDLAATHARSPDFDGRLEGQRSKQLDFAVNAHDDSR
jgi:hypothetical protein